MLSHKAHAFHVDAFGGKGVANVGRHAARSNDVAANAFRAVECAGVLCQADQAVLARGVRGACDEVSVLVYVPLDAISELSRCIPQVNPLNPAIEAMLTMLPFLPVSNHFLIARPLTIAGAVRFKAMTLSHICLSCAAKDTN